MSKEEDSKSEIGMEDYTEISDVDDDIQIGINEDINQDEIQGFCFLQSPN